MGIASIVLGVVALVFTIGGLLFSWFPFVGTVLAFGAPVLGLAGCVTGGIAISRAKQDGQPSGLGIAGLITSIMAFLFGTVIALTCGMCNACMSAGMLAPHNPAWNLDGGLLFGPQPPSSGKPPPTEPDPGAAPNEPANPAAPPPALPPPPMDSTGATPAPPAAEPPTGK